MKRVYPFMPGYTRFFTWVGWVFDGRLMGRRWIAHAQKIRPWHHEVQSCHSLPGVLQPYSVGSGHSVLRGDLQLRRMPDPGFPGPRHRTQTPQIQTLTCLSHYRTGTAKNSSTVRWMCCNTHSAVDWCGIGRIYPHRFAAGMDLCTNPSRTNTPAQSLFYPHEALPTFLREN